MFYVRNWDASFPQHSAFEILKMQLSSAQKSLQHFDASTSVRKDSYLHTEFSKVQKLAYLIQDQLDILKEKPKDSSALNFLVNGHVEQIPSLKRGLHVFNQLKNVVESKTSQVDTDYDHQLSLIKDETYKALLEKVKEFSKDESTQYGSRSDLAALKVIDVFSEYIDSTSLAPVEELKSRAVSNALSNFQVGAQSLASEIKRDLRKGEHKLYYCVLKNDLFKDVGGWKHPQYQGHTFVVEKTKEDTFRVYQGYTSQYSLQSYISSELQKSENAEMNYQRFYAFLKGLQQLEAAKDWDASMNETYKSCFGIDHYSFLGESIKENGFQVLHHSMVVELKDGSEEIEDTAQSYPMAHGIKEWLKEGGQKLYEDSAIYGKNILVGSAIGASLGAVVMGCVNVYHRVFI